MAPKNIADKYQKHELRDHIYEIPDTYAGSAEQKTDLIYVYDDESERMVERNISYVPVLYKCFDELLVNAIDQCTRLKGDKRDDVRHVKNIKVKIDKATGWIEVYNDGDGIDVDMHPTYKMHVPELIFGNLLTSTNYDKNEEKIVGGKNGYGAKITNIFSKEFVVETVDHRRKKIYTQRFFDNMRGKDAPTVKSCAKLPYTLVKYLPDYERFGMDGITDDMYAMLRKRTMDACACTDATVAVYFNDVKIPYKSFESYCDLYLGKKGEHPRVYEISENERWEVVATYSDAGQHCQVSFVNGINTLRGGKHVDHVVTQITKQLAEMVKTKKKKDVKAQHLKDNLFVFVKATIVNPSFDSQTKESLTTQVAKFGSKCELSDKFFDKLYKTGVVEKAVELTSFHEDKKLTKTDGRKTSRVLIAALDDANKAGTKDSDKCTLILTEGLSAKTMAIAGLSVVGRDHYGVFPLKGKILNVKEESAGKIAQNEEITNLKKILGLEQNHDYKNVSSLRYGRIMVMTDADDDGSHIRGLLFNLFQTMWPSLYKMPGFIVSMLTPIVRAERKGETKMFYTYADFANWRETADLRGWKLRYLKGLGSSTEGESKEYFSDMRLLKYKYTGKESDAALDMAFNKARADDRKDWIRKSDRADTLDYTIEEVPYEEFVNRELIHFSVRATERSLGHLADGMKESIRKIMFSCFKRRLYKDEIKVAQLAGYVSEVSSYHHGEQSLLDAIIGMAQDFVGAKNIPLLQGVGQFGSRIMGGKDSASPRYIFTKVSQLARMIFREEDSLVLTWNDDDGTPIEPTYYIPVVPMLLINGIKGIGSGFSTEVPPHNPTDIVAMCRAICGALDSRVGMIESEADLEQAYDAIGSVELEEPTPWYMGFKGQVTKVTTVSYETSGLYKWLDDNTLEITELPVGVWTDTYKESVLLKMITDGSPYIKDFESHSTTKNVKFILKMHPGARAALGDDVADVFKLKSKSVSVNNMHLFKPTGELERYNTVTHIMRDWACTRILKYKHRKERLLKDMQEDYEILSAKVKFISDVIANNVVVMNREDDDIEQQLKVRDYPLIEGDYAYLLRLPIRQLTKREKERLEAEAKKLADEIAALKARTLQDIWMKELDEFEAGWIAYRDNLLQEYEDDLKGAKATSGTKKTRAKK